MNRGGRGALVIGALLVPLLAGAPAAAAPQAAVVEASYTGFAVGDGSLAELVVPVALSWRIASLRMDANTAYATAEYERAGETSSLSGLTDLTVRLMLPLLQDRVRLIVAGNLPTGTESLTADELPVAAIINTDLLALPVRSFGSGTGVTSGLAVAQPAGSWVLGGIAVYRVGSAYEPVQAASTGPGAEFRPGSELRLRLAAERPGSGGAAWRVATSWSRFGRDRAEGEDIFLRGDRLMAEVSAELPVGRGAATLFAWDLYRSESSMMVSGTAQPAPASNLAGAGGELAWPVSAALTLRPRAEALVQTGEAGFGGGSGWLARVGSAASVRLGALRFDPAVHAYLGRLEGNDLLGLQLRGGLLLSR